MWTFFDTLFFAVPKVCERSDTFESHLAEGKNDVILYCKKKQATKYICMCNVAARAHGQQRSWSSYTDRSFVLLPISTGKTQTKQKLSHKNIAFASVKSLKHFDFVRHSNWSNQYAFGVMIDHSWWIFKPHSLENSSKFWLQKNLARKCPNGIIVNRKSKQQ